MSIRCKLGMHKRGPWFLSTSWHHGEYPWDKWTHLCHVYRRRPCERCGLPSKRLKNKCTGPIYTGPRQTANGYDWAGLPEQNRRLFR